MYSVVQESCSKEHTSKPVNGSEGDRLGFGSPVCNIDGDTECHHWEDQGEGTGSIPGASWGRIDTGSGYKLQGHPVAAHWVVIRLTPWLPLGWVPEGDGHLCWLANCELRILDSEKRRCLSKFIWGEPIYGFLVQEEVHRSTCWSLSAVLKGLENSK